LESARRGPRRMIIADTNVASAFMRLELEPKVTAWLDAQNLDDLFVTSISLFEIQFGIERLAKGKKRALHEARLDEVLRGIIAGRIINFDRLAAAEAAAVHVIRGKAKADTQARDSLIAGIARHHGATLATRNVKDFASLGLAIVDPWKS